MGMIEAAREYVGTTPLSGVAQMGVLAGQGMSHRSRVLEYGCGALHLARVLVPYLDPGNYVGVDPNRWLQDAALDAEPWLREVVREREAQFIVRGDFHVPDGDIKFDYVFAHSVVSHATRAELAQFLGEAYRVSRPGTTLIFSFNSGDVDTNDTVWQFPGITRFTWDTIRAELEAHAWIYHHDLAVRWFYMACCPDEFHDWCVAIRG